MSDHSELPEGKKLCPNCQALIPTTWVRCMECGKSLRPPVIRFDLEPELPSEPDTAESIPIWLPAPVWDRLFGATLPFVLSLLWVGAWGLIAGMANLPLASLFAAPALRFLLPLVASQTLKERFPYLAGGFRNALTLVLQLLGVHILFIPLYMLLLALNAFDSLLHTTWTCDGGIRSPTPADPALNFAPTPGLAVATLIVQGVMASLLPFQVQLSKNGVRLSRDVHSPQGYAALGLIALLALGWWLPIEGVRQALGFTSVLLSATLALMKITSSPDLSPKAKRGMALLVIALELLAGGLALQSGRAVGS